MIHSFTTRQFVQKEQTNNQWTLNFMSGKMDYKQQEMQLIMAEITF